MNCFGPIAALDGFYIIPAYVQSAPTPGPGVGAFSLGHGNRRRLDWHADPGYCGITPNATYLNRSSPHVVNRSLQFPTLDYDRRTATRHPS